MNKTVLLVIAISTVMSLACRPQQPTPKSEPKPAAPSAFKMELTTIPDPPPTDKTVVFRLKLTDLNGHPVAGAEVKAALDMVTMEMGKNEVAFADKGGGVYEGTGKFTMAGPWNVVVTAKQGGKTGQQTFSIAVRIV